VHGLTRPSSELLAGSISEFEFELFCGDAHP
jgi:hypothetical protein